MADKRPPKTALDLLGEVGIKPDRKLNPENAAEPDHSTLPADLDRAADYLEEYAGLIDPHASEAFRKVNPLRKEQCEVLAKKLRKRAAFRRQLTRHLGELEHLANAKAQAQAEDETE